MTDPPFFLPKVLSVVFLSAAVASLIFEWLRCEVIYFFFFFYPFSVSIFFYNSLSFSSIFRSSCLLPPNY